MQQPRNANPDAGPSAAHPAMPVQDDRQPGTAKPGEPDPSSPFNASGSASTKGKSTLRSMSDTRIKKFDKLLADQVVSSSSLPVQQLSGQGRQQLGSSCCSYY